MTTETIGLLYMLADAGPVVKFVMLVLLFFPLLHGLSFSLNSGISEKHFTIP